MDTLALIGVVGVLGGSLVYVLVLLGKIRQQVSAPPATTVRCVHPETIENLNRRMDDLERHFQELPRERIFQVYQDLQALVEKNQELRTGVKVHLAVSQQFLEQVLARVKRLEDMLGNLVVMPEVPQIDLNETIRKSFSVGLHNAQFP